MNPKQWRLIRPIPTIKVSVAIMGRFPRKACLHFKTIISGPDSDLGYHERNCGMEYKNYLMLSILYLAIALFPMELYAQGCYESTILSPTPFMGNNGEIFKLTDGSIWEVKYENESLYEYKPDVVICPNKGKMIIEDKPLNVELISSPKQISKEPLSTEAKKESPPAEVTIESQIEGDFEGFDETTLFKLMNGQIWQQSESWYHYHYAFMPNVIVYKSGGGYKIRVDGVDKSISVVPFFGAP